MPQYAMGVMVVYCLKVKVKRMKKPAILTALYGIVSIIVWAQSPQIIARTAFDSTVILIMKDSNGQAISQGSGFVIGEGQIATNYHVIEGASGGVVKLIGGITTYRLEGIAASDKERDLVILTAKLDVAKPLLLGDSDAVQIGDTVYVIGNPLGLEGTFSQGNVSGIRHGSSGRLIQLTAPISPGSSGGPVLNTAGAVVGVAVATVEGGQNLNFAVPVNFLKDLLRNASAPMGFSTSTRPASIPVQVYKVGDKGPAGGIIFHVDKRYSELPAGDRPSGLIYYYEAAPFDIASDGVPWDNGRITELQTRNGIGTGDFNSFTIIYRHGSGKYAALLCDDLVYGGCDDWFLPSIDELHLMHIVLANNKMGDFTSAGYWSSSQYDAIYAYVEDFSNRLESAIGKKSDFFLVRPIRRFFAFRD